MWFLDFFIRAHMVSFVINAQNAFKSGASVCIPIKNGSSNVL